MALIKCSECGKEISDKSDNCVHCGMPLKSVTRNVENKITHWIPLCVSVLDFFLLIMIYNVMNTQTDSSTFYTVFNTILLLLSAFGIGSCFYLIPRERKILFPLSIIAGVFVFFSVMGTAFGVFN